MKHTWVTEKSDHQGTSGEHVLNILRICKERSGNADNGIFCVGWVARSYASHNATQFFKSIQFSFIVIEQILRYTVLKKPICCSLSQTYNICNKTVQDNCKQL